MAERLQKICKNIHTHICNGKSVPAYEAETPALTDIEAIRECINNAIEVFDNIHQHLTTDKEPNYNTNWNLTKTSEIKKKITLIKNQLVTLKDANEECEMADCPSVTPDERYTKLLTKLTLGADQTVTQVLDYIKTQIAKATSTATESEKKSQHVEFKAFSDLITAIHTDLGPQCPESPEYVTPAYLSEHGSPSLITDIKNNIRNYKDKVAELGTRFKYLKSFRSSLYKMIDTKEPALETIASVVLINDDIKIPQITWLMEIRKKLKKIIPALGTEVNLTDTSLITDKISTPLAYLDEINKLLNTQNLLNVPKTIKKLQESKAHYNKLLEALDTNDITIALEIVKEHNNTEKDKSDERTLQDQSRKRDLQITISILRNFGIVKDSNWEPAENLNIFEIIEQLSKDYTARTLPNKLGAYIDEFILQIFKPALMQSVQKPEVLFDEHGSLFRLSHNVENSFELHFYAPHLFKLISKVLEAVKPGSVMQAILDLGQDPIQGIMTWLREQGVSDESLTKLKWGFCEEFIREEKPRDRGRSRTPRAIPKNTDEHSIAQGQSKGGGSSPATTSDILSTKREVYKSNRSRSTEERTPSPAQESSRSPTLGRIRSRSPEDARTRQSSPESTQEMYIHTIKKDTSSFGNYYVLPIKKSEYRLSYAGYILGESVEAEAKTALPHFYKEVSERLETHPDDCTALWRLFAIEKAHISLRMTDILTRDKLERIQTNGQLAENFTKLCPEHHELMPSNFFERMIDEHKQTVADWIRDNIAFPAAMYSDAGYQKLWATVNDPENDIRSLKLYNYFSREKIKEAAHRHRKWEPLVPEFNLMLVTELMEVVVIDEVLPNKIIKFSRLVDVVGFLPINDTLRLIPIPNRKDMKELTNILQDEIKNQIREKWDELIKARKGGTRDPTKLTEDVTILGTMFVFDRGRMVNTLKELKKSAQTELVQELLRAIPQKVREYIESGLVQFNPEFHSSKEDEATSSDTEMQKARLFQTKRVFKRKLNEGSASTEITAVANSKAARKDDDENYNSDASTETLVEDPPPRMTGQKLGITNPVIKKTHSGARQPGHRPTKKEGVASFTKAGKTRTCGDNKRCNELDFVGQKPPVRCAYLRLDEVAHESELLSIFERIAIARQPSGDDTIYWVSENRIPGPHCPARLMPAQQCVAIDDKEWQNTWCTRIFRNLVENNQALEWDEETQGFNEEHPLYKMCPPPVRVQAAREAIRMVMSNNEITELEGYPSYFEVTLSTHYRYVLKRFEKNNKKEPEIIKVQTYVAFDSDSHKYTYVYMDENHMKVSSDNPLVLNFISLEVVAEVVAEHDFINVEARNELNQNLRTLRELMVSEIGINKIKEGYQKSITKAWDFVCSLFDLIKTKSDAIFGRLGKFGFDHLVQNLYYTVVASFALLLKGNRGDKYNVILKILSTLQTNNKINCKEWTFVSHAKPGFCSMHQLTKQQRRGQRTMQKPSMRIKTQNRTRESLNTLRGNLRSNNVSNTRSNGEMPQD